MPSCAGPRRVVHPRWTVVNNSGPQAAIWSSHVTAHAEEEVVLRPYHPTTFTLGEREIRIRVKRFSLDDMARFDRLEAALEPQMDRLLLVRKTAEELERAVPTEAQTDERDALLADINRLAERFGPARDEAAADAIALLRILTLRVMPVETYRIPDEEIRRRRQRELTEAERAEVERLEQVYRDAATELARVVVRDYVTVEPGQLVMVDDQDERTSVTTGEQLLTCFGGRLDVMRQLVAAVRRENILTDEQKKDWRSRFGSTRSSASRDQAVSGLRPDVAAAPAEPEGSVSPVAATGVSETSRSGSMATLS
jgi:hypothetical protein